MTLREEIVAAAYGWMGTPYKHKAAVKGPDGGVDCAQILAEVYAEVGIVPRFDLGNYSTQWHQHFTEELYLNWLALAGAWQIHTPPLPGDIGVWRYGLTHAHGGIVVEAGPDPLILHSHIKARRGVTLTRVSEYPLSAATGNQFWSIIYD